MQSVAIGFYLAPLPDGFAPVSATLMGFAVVLTVATGLDYVIQAVRLRAGGGAPAHDGSTDGSGARPRMVDALVGRGQTLATAESLTAGLLAATVAGVPGASAVLRGGFVVYATDLKGSLAGVDRPCSRRTARSHRRRPRSSRMGRGNAAVPIGASG